MPTSTTTTELGQSKVLTKNGVMTATVVDRVGPDRLYLLLLRGSVAAQYGRKADQTPLLDPELRSLIVNPNPE